MADRSIPRTLTRREVLASGAALLGTAAGASWARTSVVATSQFDSTPPAPPDTTPAPSADPISDLAAQLSYDREAIFAFVRDEIHYESYAGVLRGPKGTLWAMAGNSTDQAVLLSALFAASQIPHRYAFCALSAEATTALAEAHTITPATVRAAFDAALVASTPASASNSTPEPTASQREDIDRTLQQAADLRDLATARIDALSQILTTTLQDAAITLPELTAGIDAFDTANHTWIQVADGPTWVDFDPSLPGDASPGTPASTADTLPDSMIHALTIRLVVEELTSGVPYPRDALTWERQGWQLVNTPLALAMTGPGDLTDIGVAIGSLFTGAVTFAPTLLAGEEATVTTSSFSMGVSGADGVVGAFEEEDNAAADGETTAVWLVVEIRPPDGAPIVVERVLVDRIGPVVRASGTVTAADITPLVTVQDLNGKTTIPEFAGITFITCDVARLPTIYAINDAWTADVFGPLYQFGSSLASFRNAIGFDLAVTSGVDRYPTQPGITAFAVRAGLSESGEPNVTLTADLLYQPANLTRLDDVPPPNHPPQVLASVLDQVAERVLLAATVEAFADSQPASLLPDVGSIFEAAVATDVPLLTLQDPDSVNRIETSDDTRVRLRTILDLGLIVIAPATPVVVDDQTAFGWWVVDPLNGRMWDEAENGMGFAGGTVRRHALVIDYSRLLAMLRSWGVPYAALGRCMAIVISQAVMASDYSGSGGGVDAFIETFKNLDPQATKDCFK